MRNACFVVLRDSSPTACCFFPHGPVVGVVQKSHPLGKRAAKIDQGILVIRFETPYNMWCLGCNNHIGRGVRYNAEKRKIGMYFTTPIWEFTLKCHLCDNKVWWSG